MENENIVFNTEDVNQNKVYGILAYIGFLFIVPLLAAKESPYAKFHANQGLVLFLAEFILGVVVGVINVILTIATLGVLTPLCTLLSSAVTVFGFVLMVMGIINANSGEAKKLPLIGNITIIK